PRDCYVVTQWEPAERNGLSTNTTPRDTTRTFFLNYIPVRSNGMGNTASNSMVGTSKNGAGADRTAQPPSAAARLIHVVAVCSALLMCVIVAGTATIIVNLRARALADTERELRNMALVLAEQI